MKKQAEAFPCDTVSCADVKFSTNIKGSCKTTENFHVHYIAEKEGGGDKFEIFFCYFPIQHVFHLLVIKSKGIFIHSFVWGLSFTMLCNLCLTEVRPVFQLSEYSLHNLEGEVLCNTLSTKNKEKRSKGKRVSSEVSRFKGHVRDLGILFFHHHQSHTGVARYEKSSSLPPTRRVQGREGGALAPLLLDLFHLAAPPPKFTQWDKAGLCFFGSMGSCQGHHKTAVKSFKWHKSPCAGLDRSCSRPDLSPPGFF